MKKSLFTLALALLLIAVSATAKKVKLTIDGTLSPTQRTLYLIVNEDTANAQRIAITDAKFSVNLKVDANDIIRLHDWKEWPERSVFVLLPDSRHITINWRTGTIEGSPKSLRMQQAIREAREDDPSGFHIDVFSDDKEAWEQARIQGESIRAQMLAQQKQTIMRLIKDNNNNIGAWLAYCYAPIFEGGLPQMTNGTTPKWLSHPIFKAHK
ncbi:MAG: hypothetical protein IJT90_06120 [Bacteroidaceae bacterium]|nr:hypothetical protein [Bacteroidaceae bacterium]